MSSGQSSVSRLAHYARAWGGSEQVARIRRDDRCARIRQAPGSLQVVRGDLVALTAHAACGRLRQKPAFDGQVLLQRWAAHLEVLAEIRIFAGRQGPPREHGLPRLRILGNKGMEQVRCPVGKIAHDGLKFALPVLPLRVLLRKQRREGLEIVQSRCSVRGEVHALLRVPALVRTLRGAEEFTRSLIIVGSPRNAILPIPQRLAWPQGHQLRVLAEQSARWPHLD
mmetsp:Transcript_30784/g.75734  ORF Transcript_30784/g.75734 Transcript_30784/m.75734 type:complete len:225 (-) Transcript_30784:333-1007(-)